MGGQPSNYQRNFVNHLCQLCSSRSSDSPDHILFACEALAPQRHTLWESVILEMPVPMRNTVIEMTNLEKVKFILSCCNECYVDEWRNLYKAIANFVYKIYVKRSHLYDNAENEIHDPP